MISGAGDSQSSVVPVVVGAVLGEACREVGLDSGGAELLRFGSNAVYRLGKAPVIVRIAQGASGMPDAERSVRVARWLAEEDLPATRALPGVRQPLLVGGHVVTFWESAQDREEYATVAELADLLRRLHGLAEPPFLGLPHYDPMPKVRESLRGLVCVSDDDRSYLEERAARLGEEYGRLGFALPFGVIHGDANIGNVLRHRNGQAILSDLDSFALAPREWDLVLTAIYFDRYGWHTRSQYEEFARRYGFDIRNWAGYKVLGDLRELRMTLWMGRRAAANEQAAAEFAHRVADIRSGDERHGWRPF
ncbi:phosphotransferase enzyme family protein [Streptomyces sp. NPDC057197]|uniref:phosphotransferase enzyme family protein n=1 Tax=Streptomyces sp. NPDC057197 TaxID=3346045 RepID=UPI003638ADAA